MKRSVFLFLIILSLFMIIPDIISAEIESKAWFIKKDEEGNLIKDAEFKIYDLFGNNTFEVTNESNEDESYYTFNNQNLISYDKAIGMLNEEQVSLIESIKTYSDYLEKKAILEKEYTTVNEFISDLDNTKGVKSYIEYNDNSSQEADNIDYISLTATNFLVLEETKAPIGLSRNKYILPVEVSVRMITEPSTGELAVLKAIYVIKPNLITKYNSEVNYKNLKSVIQYLVDNKDSINNEIKTGCGINYNNVLSIFGNFSDTMGAGVEMVAHDGYCSNNPVLVDKKGTYDVSVTSYVNDSESASVIKHDTVKVKVKLSNNGDVDSYNNTIKSQIPEGLTYVSNSASDNGTYNEENNTVEWTIDKLEPLSSKEFSYDVIVPNSAKTNVKFVSNASLSSDNVSEPVLSNNASINVTEIVNPKTSDFQKVEIISIMIFVFSISFVIFNRKSFINL